MLLRRSLLFLLLLALAPAVPGTAGAAGTLAAQSLADYDYENLSFRGIGVDIGRVLPNKVDAATAYSLRFDLGYLGPYVRIAPSFTYWKSRYTDEELARFAERLNRLPGTQVDAAALGPIDWSNFAFAVDGHVFWDAPFGISPYAGLGLAVHALNGRGPVIEGTFVEDLLDTVTAGASAVAGIDVRIARNFQLYGAGRYTVLSGIRYTTIQLGAGFVLPARVSVQ
jgi:hypothetical protein